MSEVTFSVKATVGEDTREVTGLTYDFGDNLQEAIALHGEEVVYRNFFAQAKVGKQAAARAKAQVLNEDGSYKFSDDEIREDVKNSTIEVRAPAKTKEEKYLSDFAKLDAETQIRLLKELKKAKSAE